MDTFDKDYNKEAFSKNLERLMKKNNIKNIDLAKKLNLSKSAISNYLNGTSVPRTDIIAEIASFFCVHIESLFKEKFEHEKVSNPKLKTKQTGVSLAFHEGDPNDISYYQAPMFTSELSKYDIVYSNTNFCDRILSTFPFYGDFECYAVRVRENNIAALPMGAVAIFAATLKAENSELAAVLYKEDRKILIRRVEFTNDNVILKTDETEEKYKYSARNCPVLVLGKVVNVMYTPN